MLLLCVLPSAECKQQKAVRLIRLEARVVSLQLVPTVAKTLVNLHFIGRTKYLCVNRRTDVISLSICCLYCLSLLSILYSIYISFQ